MNITRTGKIARLPKTLREELNRRLADGEPGKDLVAWLNGLPEVQRVVAAEFGGRAVREQNLSEWKQGGYAEWRQQEALELVRSLAAETDDLQAAALEPLTEKLGLWLAARYAVAARQLAADDGALDWARLRELCHDVVALRRGDHSAARLQIEQARLEREREETEEEAVAHFQRWAQNPKVREAICGHCHSEEEKAQRLRALFGLATPAASTTTVAPGGEAGSGRGDSALPAKPIPSRRQKRGGWPAHPTDHHSATDGEPARQPPASRRADGQQRQGDDLAPRPDEVAETIPEK